jgi:hypothetical protein
VGLSVSGRLGGPLRLRYTVELSNGIGVEGSRTVVQSAGDQNTRKSIVGAVQIRPTRLPGWQLGVAALVDQVAPAEFAPVSERVFSGHLVYQDDRWEWITEGYGIRHRRRESAAANSTAFYTQVARRMGQLRPFVRFERLDVADADPFHAFEAGAVQGPSAGVRFDPTTYVGAKAQLDWLSGDNRVEQKRFIAQLSFAF